MKLTDKIISNLEFRPKKNNSLVSAIENIKYYDLVSISSVIDNSNFLNQFSNGWNPIHYAVLNTNPEVLYFIANLYKKNNCDLNQKIQRAKNGVKIGETTLDIAIRAQKLEHYLILKHFNIKEHKNISFYLKNSKISKEEEELKLPFEYSLVNLFTLTFRCEGLKLLEKDLIYDEKPQVIKEFLDNHIFMVNNYYDKPVFTIYESFFNKLIKFKDNYDINCFDFFALILIKDFYIRKENISPRVIYYFYDLYKENISDFFDDLNTSKYKDVFISNLKKINEINITKKNKNISEFIEYFNINKFLLSLKLENKFTPKNISNKQLKI
jgi:hypothetical protein